MNKTEYELYQPFHVLADWKPNLKIHQYGEVKADVQEHTVLLTGYVYIKVYLTHIYSNNIIGNK